MCTANSKTKDGFALCTRRLLQLVKNVLGAAITLIALFCIGPSMHSQTTTGTLNGVVYDSSGAVVPGAQVKVRNIDTNDLRSTRTDSAGFYAVPALLPGSYEATVTLTGFEKATTQFSLALNQVRGLDFHLKVGSSSQTVEVYASNAVALETEDHDLDSIVEDKVLEFTPQYSGTRGATFYALTLSVGVQPDSEPGAGGGGGSVNHFNAEGQALLIGGQGNASSTYIQDGVPNTNYMTQSANVEPSVESTKEVNLIRSDASARYDRAGVVNVVTQNGTTTYKGVLYDEFENNQLNALPYFSPINLEYRYNQFGANLGGPVPKVKKLFFFFDYQGLRWIYDDPLNGAGYMPTASELNGDFSQTVADNQFNAANAYQAFAPTPSGESGFAIFDPTTFNPSNPFGLSIISSNGVQNVIPPGRINPFAQNYLKKFYSANAANLWSLAPFWAVPLAADGANFLNNGVDSTMVNNHDDYMYRLDYNLSEKDHLYGTYESANPYILRPNIFSDVGSDSDTQVNELYGTNVSLHEDHVFSASLMNSARVGYGRAIVAMDYANVGTTNYFSEFGLTGLTPPQKVWAPPSVGLSYGYSNLSGGPTNSTQNLYQIMDEVSWVHGKHSIYFGIEMEHVDFDCVWWAGSPDGSFGENGEYTSLPAWANEKGGFAMNTNVYPQNSLADFLLGLTSSVGASAGSPIGYFHQWNIMPYVQDDWRVNSKLTLNVGVRYDFYQPPQEKNNHAGIYNIQANTYKLGSWPSNYLNFAPRVGFAYKVTDKIALHGGYGIYYYEFPYNDLSNMMNDPYYITALNSTQSAAQPVINLANNPITGLPAGSVNLFTIAQAQVVFAAMPAPTGQFIGGNTAAPNMPTSYSEQFNLAVQEAFGKDWLAAVDYIGSENHHGYFFSNVNQAALPSATDSNPSSAADINSRRPYPWLAANLGQMSKWNSSYGHGLEAQLQKRFSSGFEVNTNFVWQKIMDYQSQDLVTPEYGNDPQMEKGRSGISQKYVYKLSPIYELPIGRGERFLNGGNWFESQLGGWRASGLFWVNSGWPFTVTAQDLSYTGGGITMRANRTCDGNKGAPHTVSEWFNTSCYSQPTAGTLGNERRNDLTGPRNTNLDLSLFKEFPIAREYAIQFRANLFSALNHPLFDNPNASLTNKSTYGTVSGAGGNRIAELSLKILW